MTREEAQSVIMTEQKCVDRASTDRCNRDCANCDLIMDDAVINEAYNMAIKALEQPEPCEDAISRNDAIEAIIGQPPEPHYPSWYAEQIKKLPPVTPKQEMGIIRCKDCKWYVYGADEGENYCRNSGIGETENFYCADAERREE